MLEKCLYKQFHPQSVKWCLLIVLLASFVVVSFYSYTTSPFYTEPSSGDSAMFMTIGKYWMEGNVPYISLWDSKGPLIFFFNAMGAFRIGGIWMLFVIQLLLFSITNVFIFYWLLKYSQKPLLALVATILTMMCMGMLYNGGNTVEEYLIPLITYSFYKVYEWSVTWSKDGKTYHPPISAFLYGIVLAFCLFSRLTNAVGLCFAVLFIAIVLIVNKQWRNLINNAMAFVLGFLLLAIPIAVYFYANDALDEMWYATITYNLDYANHSGSAFNSLRDIAGILLKYNIVVILIITSLMSLFTARVTHKRALLWLLVSFFTMAWFLRSNGYAHYAMIGVPYCAIAFLELFDICCDNGLLRKLSISVVVYYSVVALLGMANGVRLLNMYKDNNALVEIRKVLKQLPPGYKSSFVAWNSSVDVYIYEDIKPATRFFAFQDWAVKCSKSLLPRVNESLRKDKPRWILTKSIDDSIIKFFIDENYTLFTDDKSAYKVYRLK